MSGKLLVQMLNHALSVMVSAQRVSLNGLYGSSDETDALLNVGIDQLVVLVDVRD